MEASHCSLYRWLLSKTMDRSLLEAAMRVLRGTYSGAGLSVHDVELLREHALPEERDLELEDLADAIIWRLVQTVTRAKGEAGR
jgi:hypothetical protein